MGGRRPLWAQPVVVRGLPRTIDIDAYGDVVCALSAEGGIYCWGGKSAHCGPAYVDTYQGAARVAVGKYAAYVVTSEGKVRWMAWVGQSVQSFWRTASVVEPVPAAAGPLVPAPFISTSTSTSSVHLSPTHVRFPYKTTNHHGVPVEGLPPIVALESNVDTCGVDQTGGVHCWSLAEDVLPADAEHWVWVSGGLSCGSSPAGSLCTTLGVAQREGEGSVRAMTRSCQLSETGRVRCVIEGEPVEFDDPDAVSLHEGVGQVCTLGQRGGVRCRKISTELPRGLGEATTILVGGGVLPSAGRRP